jgi:large subunit ribosomal protein L25
MSETYSIEATVRENSKHSARECRAAGNVPGVIYGQGKDAKNLAVNYSDFLRLFRRAGQSTLIDLKLDGKTTKVLVHQYDLDPVQDTFTHVDFYEVDMKKPTVVHIPLTFIGESMAVKNLGGTFIKERDELEVRCLPGDIVHHIEVDISGLDNIHDSIKIADLNLPESYELMVDHDQTSVCSIAGRVVATEESAESTTETAE